MSSPIAFIDSDGDPQHRPTEGKGYDVASREYQAEYRAKVARIIAPKLAGYRPSQCDYSHKGHQSADSQDRCILHLEMLTARL